MKRTKKEKLQKNGWKAGSATDFLELTEEEAAMIELKIALARDLKRCRQSRNLTQTQLARLLHSSQSRVARMEAGDPSVSLDLLMKSLLSLGVSPKRIAKTFSSLSTT